MSKPKIFISYKRKHQPSEDFITQFEKSFSEGFDLLRDANMELGKRWTRELYDWLLNCDAAVVVVSKEANESEWCRREWAVLAARWNICGIPVLPVFVEGKYFETKILDEIQAGKPLLNNKGVFKRVRSALSAMPEQNYDAKDFLAAHQAWLSWQFNDAPVFEREPYSLSQVYVEPECGELTWEQIENNKIDPFGQKEAECGGRELLLDTVMDRIADDNFKDLLTVQAGPGAGKSAFTLRLANELLKETFLPIVVRFRDLRLAVFSNVPELLDDAIRIGYTNEDSPNPDSAIIEKYLDEKLKFRGTTLSKLVIILDGWDEVSLTGNASFKAQLTSWLPKLRQYFTERRGTKIRLILTGRPSAEVSQSGVLRKATSVLTMRPIQPKQLEQFAAEISTCLQVSQESSKQEDAKASWSLDIEALSPVFEHYQEWFDRDEKGNDSSTGDFLGNPLLAYLSFRVFAETQKTPEDLISQPTALYHEPINITANHAGKGEDGKLEETVHRGGDKLRRLLQEVAATISILRMESVSFTELEERFEDTELPIPSSLVADWHSEVETSNALQELVINFYFKGGNTNLGCEFLHKSFREYLFAEAIYHALLDEAEGREGLFECKAYKYWEEFEVGTPEYRLSRRLSYLLAPQWMSDEVRTHLFWLIENGVAKEPDKWIWIRDLVLSVYAWWAEGVMLRHQPMRSRSKGRWKPPYIDELFQQVIPFASDEGLAPIKTNVLDAHLGEALMQITAFVFNGILEELANSVFSGRNVNYISESEELRFKPGGDGFFRVILSRIESAGWRKKLDLGGMYLKRVCLENENLGGVYGFNCDLERAKLNEAYISRAYLDDSNLIKADFSQAQLVDTSMMVCDLSKANFTSANLYQTNFQLSQIQDCNFEESKHLDCAIGISDKVQKRFKKYEND